MNKEKEIEEMAYILSGECKSGCKTCSHLSEWGCAEYDRAVELQKSGYGNVKQAVKEFANYLSDYACACRESGYDGIGAQDIQDKFKEFYKE